MASRDNNYKLVYQLQTKLVVSYAARALAARKVISGGQTPGIDKQFWDESQKRMDVLLDFSRKSREPSLKRHCTYSKRV